MSDGHRRTYSAVARSGLIALLVTAPVHGGQVEAASANQNPKGAERQSGNAAPGPAGAPIIIKVQPTAQEVEAEGERQAAQRRILGLQPDAWVALFTFVLGVSTIGLWRETRRLAKGAEDQLGTLKDSVTQATRAADAAKDSAESYRATVRPLVGLKTFVVTPMQNGLLNDLPVKNGIMFQMRFINTGATAATNMNVYGDHKLVAMGDSTMPTFTPGETPPSNASLAPNVTFDTIGRCLNDADTKAVTVDDTSKVILYARVHYEDVMSSSVVRITECCFEAVHSGNTTDAVTGVVSPRWVFRPMGPQNRAT